jgi:predicted Zn-dependent protease
MLATPLSATAPKEDIAARYASARIAEIGERDHDALTGYLKLYRQAPDSDILADRLFDSAIRSGDMTTAVRAARAKELRNASSSETALLLFADAWRQKNWILAGFAADQLAQGANLAFMAPILRSWVRVAQGLDAELPDADTEADGMFAYYSADQRIYLDLAAAKHARAKLGLRDIAAQSGEHVRDVMIAGAATLAGSSGDPAFADALMRSANGSTDGLVAGPAKLPVDLGLATLYGRIANALIEQDMPKEGLVLARIGQWISPSQPNMVIALAKAMHANGMKAEALHLLRQQSPDSPYRLNILESQVDIMLEMADVDGARSIVARAMQSQPKSVALKLLFARVEESVGNMPLVVASYREMTEAAEFAELPVRQQASYRLLLAAAHDRAGNWPSAKSELEKLLTADPNNAQALNYLGYSLLERDGVSDAATALVERAHRLEPTSSAITDSLGWAYYLRGDIVRAVPLLEKAAKAAVSDVAINEHLGDAYWAVGRRREARYAWRAARLGSEGDDAVRLSQKIDAGPPDGRR